MGKSMREVTRRIVVDKFLKGINGKERNTESRDGSLLLYGHKIAWHEHGKLWIDLCGWNTVTTRERLSALQGVTITSRNGTPYVNGIPWDGSAVAVYDFIQGTAS